MRTSSVLDSPPRLDSASRRDVDGVQAGVGSSSRLALAALGVVTIVGVCIRLRGLSDLGLWRDDAWVADITGLPGLDGLPELAPFLPDDVDDAEDSGHEPAAS